MRGPASVAVAGARVAFGSTVALGGVDLFASGGVCTLLGPNGAGKTTLLRALATARPLDSGSVAVDGLDAAAPAQRAEIRRRLGYLPQRPAFGGAARVFDVGDYLAICKEIGPPRLRHAEVARVLREVDLWDVARRRVRSLSGGMVQRLGLAQALLGEPTLVVLDEPATGLDPDQRLRLREQLSRLGERATVVISTHLTDEAAAFSQRLVVLDGGVVRFTGTPAGLAERAAGRVWLAADAPAGPQVRRSWRTGDGRWRCVGDPPVGAQLDRPTIEDAYLLLVGGD